NTRHSHFSRCRCVSAGGKIRSGFSFPFSKENGAPFMMKPWRFGFLCSSALMLLMFPFGHRANGQTNTVLVGSGSNVPTPLYNHWVEEYNKLNPKVQVRYMSTGTVKGIDDISRGIGDFAAGEVPMSDEQVNAAKSPILQIPTVLVAIVPIYHVPGVPSGLRF